MAGARTELWVGCSRLAITVSVMRARASARSISGASRFSRVGKAGGWLTALLTRAKNSAGWLLRTIPAAMPAANSARVVS